jgi:16S rRNA (uracil1498-N3)-methyltransferase
MHRFYLAPDECADKVLLLKDRQAHHAAHVLRLQPKESVIVLDGVGTELDCTVQRVSRNEVALLVCERRQTPRSAVEVTLLQAIVKGKAMETIIQKATELGVTRIIPLQTDRIVPHLDQENQKQTKWQITAIETIKQCGSRWLPQIDVPVAPAGFLKRTESFDLALVASLAGDGRHARHWFERFTKEPSAALRTVCIWIGPEGDFTTEELDLIRSSGAKPITLGRLVLRADTAAVYSLSVIHHELAWISATAPKS